MQKEGAMNHQLKLRTVVALAVLLIMTACTRESNQNQPVTTTTNTGTSNAPPASEVKQRGNALVRVINAIPGEPSVDVSADDAKVFTGIAHKTTTPYKEVSAERHTFRIRPAGKDTAPPLAENSEGLSNGKHYTAVAWTDTGGKPSLYIVDDDLVPPSSGKAKVRVIQASPNTGEIDVYAKEGNKKLVGGVNPLKATSYSELDPISGTIEVRPSGKNNAVLTIPNAKFNAGDVYTIVVMGQAKGATKPEATIVEDKLAGASTTAPAANANANANANASSNRSANANRNSNANRSANAR
jgi:hypothetical protein